MLSSRSLRWYVGGLRPCPNLGIRFLAVCERVRGDWFRLSGLGSKSSVVKGVGGELVVVLLGGGLGNIRGLLRRSVVSGYWWS